MSESPVRTAATPSDDPIANVIAVASGKGGVGKTWLSISLAQALSKLGQRVLLFDGDLGLANVDVQLGIQPGMDLGTALERHLPLSRAVINYPSGGFDLIAGRSGSGSLASMPINRLQALAQGLRAVGDSYGRVVVDLGAGIERPVRYLASRAAFCLVVTTDEPTALTDAYALIKILSRDHGVKQFRVLANQSRGKGLGQALFQRFERVTTRFLSVELDYVGEIPEDAFLRRAIREQRPVVTAYPSCPASMALKTLALRADMWPVAEGPRGNVEFFVERLIRRPSVRLEVVR